MASRHVGWRPLIERMRDLPQHPWTRPALAALVALILGIGLGVAIGRNGQESDVVAQGSSAKPVEGDAWSLFGHPRSPAAARRGLPRPSGFAYWRQRLDTQGNDPKACLELSRPLDPAKNYADFLLIAPDLGHPPAVRVVGGELCLSGLGFTDRRITLLKGLPSAEGDALAANIDVDFSFGEKPPYVGFAGDGVILPRDQADGVGIETINVQTLAIEVWRVRDRNLTRKSISAPQPTSEGDYPDDYGDDSANDIGRRVWKGQMAVTGGRGGAKVTTVFPLGAVLKDMKPGGYVIKAKDASGGRAFLTEESGSTNPAQARRWVIFTDMALMGYSGSEALDVVVRSLKSARPLDHTRVALVAENGEDLAVGQTDGEGRVRFLKPLLAGEGGGRAKMVMAYGEAGDLAVLDLDRSPIDLSKPGAGGDSPVAGRAIAGPVDGFIYADRGIYRPGERVNLTALIRDAQGRSVKERSGALILLRPSGVEFSRYRFDSASGGFAGATVNLPKSAPRGRWTARLEIDGYEKPVGEMSFSVEDFAPQRLAVTANGDEMRPLAAGETRPLAISARFLYGASGSGLQTQGEARLAADPNPFPAFKDFQWGDAVAGFDERALDLASTVTDGEGRATLSFSAPDASTTAIPLKATVTASVFEPGGRPVRESLFLKVRPKPLYLGAKVTQGDAARGDPPVTIDVIGVAASGSRRAAMVNYSLISESWTYDWFQQDGRWQYRRSSRDAVVQKGVLNVSATAPARLARRLGWGDYRLVLDGPEGARSVIKFASGWGAAAKEGDAPDQVRLSAGPGRHAQGDMVDVMIKAPFAGEVQVAVATDRLIDLKRVTLGETGGKVRVKSSAAWGGGAYVMVTVIQPRDPVKSPKPRRALGLIYVPLDPKNRTLTVKLGTPSRLGASQPVTVPIKIDGLAIGQTARVTVAAVDEGILRLTRFESPDPVKWYFGKRALGVDYRDDYGRLLDPNLGPPANVNFGADSLGGEGLTVTPIKSVALWSGIVETGLDGTANVRLPAAAFNGELRIMAVAWTDTAVGSNSQAVTVREPVVADLNLPRFLAPGDRAMAMLELHNLDGKPGLYTASAEADGGVIAVFRKVLKLLLGQRVVQSIPIQAPSFTGIGNVGFNVAGPGFTTRKDYPIQTRLGWDAITRTTTTLQRPGDVWTPPADLLSGLAAGDVSLQVSYSPFKGFDPAPIANALSRYPYGCTEQIVSVAYPLLYALEVSKDPRLARSSQGLNGAVSQLIDRQTLDGTFGLWRVGDGQADAWLGAYATDFLIEARRRGAPVPDGVIDHALGAMRQISRPEDWVSNGYRTQYPDWWDGTADASKAATIRMRSRASAYALYVLAKSGHGDLGRLRWWHDVQLRAEGSPLARAQVAAGLAAMGDRSRARSALRQAVNALGYRDPADWYQTPLRDLAGVIALAYEAGEPDMARQIQGRLDGAVRDPDALNTQEQARLLQAAHAMLAVAGPIQIKTSGATVLSPAGGAKRWAVGKLAAARFQNAGGPVWRTTTVRGTPLSAPSAGSNGLSISKQWLTFGGAVQDPARLRQGDRVIVLLKGRSDQARTLALVVDDALPAGLEIETVLGPADAQSGPFKFLGDLETPNVQERRDDRYMASIDLAGNKPFALAYVARAVTPGSFFLPSVQARDMYRQGFAARSASGRMSIAPSN